MEKTAVTVKIFNDEYTLKTDLPRTECGRDCGNGR